jgi:hypothetical protein
MMLCQALMRHMLGEDHRLDYVVNEPIKSQHYRAILRSILDND